MRRRVRIVELRLMRGLRCILIARKRVLRRPSARSSGVCALESILNVAHACVLVVVFTTPSYADPFAGFSNIKVIADLRRNPDRVPTQSVLATAVAHPASETALA